MTADYPLGTEPATSEYVLDVFRAWHAQLAAVGQADSEHPPIFDMSVDDFLGHTIEDTYEDHSWKGLADALNMMWELKLPREVWRPVLHPLRQHTVRELCEFIAERTDRPVIRPWPHVAGQCLPAGAFLTVQSLIARCRTRSPAQVTPSTPLARYVTREFDDSWWRLARIAPGVALLREVVYPVWAKIAMMVIGFGSFLLLPAAGVAWLVGWPWAPALVMVFAIGIAVVLVIDQSTVSSRPVTHGLVTFRDLAYRLAGQEPRRRIQPSA